MKRTTLVLGSIALLFVVLGLSCAASYNKLVALDQAVTSQWAQVENVYQRRADLVPNLVETVKGAANFESGTIVAVTEARAQVGKTTIGKDALSDPEAFKHFQQAQDQLSAALSRLLVVVRGLSRSCARRRTSATCRRSSRAPRIASPSSASASTKPRRRSTPRASSFPTTILAGFFGSRFNEKAYFKAQARAATAPQVKF